MAKCVGNLPAPMDLCLYQGDDFFLVVALSMPDGTPADLTGATAEAQVRETPEATAVLADFEATVAGNEVTLHLAATDTAVLTGIAVWDLQLTYPSGVIATVYSGKVTVSPEVTR